MSFKLSAQLLAVCNDGTDLSPSPDSFEVPFTGSKGTSHNEDVTSSDSTFSLEAVSVPGWIRLENLALYVPADFVMAGTPIITNNGTPGSTTRAYKIVAYLADGTHSVASSAGTSTTGAAALNSTDFETIDWTLFAVPGADHYGIFRTTAGGTPSSTGLIGTVSGGITTFDDTGFVGDASTPPASAADNVLLIGHTSGTYPQMLRGGEIAYIHWNGASFATIHRKANTRTIPIWVTIFDD